MAGKAIIIERIRLVCIDRRSARQVFGAARGEAAAAWRLLHIKRLTTHAGQRPGIAALAFMGIPRRILFTSSVPTVSTALVVGMVGSSTGTHRPPMWLPGSPFTQTYFFLLVTSLGLRRRSKSTFAQPSLRVFTLARDLGMLST